MNDSKVFVTQSSLPSYEEYCSLIKQIWDNHILTNNGPIHQDLEKSLKEYCNVDNLSLFTNGHLSLETALLSLDLRGEVITTPFTFVSTTNAIARNGLKPVFCDIKSDDYTIDPSKIEKLITKNTCAILPVHVYGNICDVKEIERIAKKYDLKIVYDAAHAFGEKYYGESVANFGDISMFSFHATKVFNTIEGGAVCSKNHEVYEKLYNLKNFGIRSEELVVSVGANAKMNEFEAIMGLCNLKHIDSAINDRKRVSEKYTNAFKEVEGIRLLKFNDNTESNYAYYPIVLEDKYHISRDELYNNLMEKDIYTRKYFYPITADHACFKNKYKYNNLNTARDIAKKVLLLPIYEGLKDETIDRIVTAVLK